MKKIGIWGWWQGNNLGDNWIKDVLSKQFKHADFLPTSVRDFSGYDFIICGGGGLFIYDVINPFKNVDVAVPYGILGMGAEFEHESRIAVELQRKAAFFLVRDGYSVDCMHLTEECRSYDVTFIEPLPFENKNNLNFKKVFFVWRDGKELLNNSKFEKYIKYIDSEKEWIKIVKDNFEDIKYDDFQTNESDIINRINDCGFVISGRYHGIVAAIQRGVPFLAIDICPKIRALVDECGLSEYCIKISEFSKAKSLIIKAKNNINFIRKKEYEFRNKAMITINYQMIFVKNAINKELYPIRVLHYGSYWMGDNDVINTMSDDLLETCEGKKIDLCVYSSNPDKRVKNIEKTPNGIICTLDSNLILEDIEDFRPDAIVLNSGGLCVDEELFEKLKNKKIKTVGISLSDPDVYPYNGEKYAHFFDYFYTNSEYSFKNQYNKNNVNIGLFPFAASIKHHYYMPEIKKEYDLIIVGHARKDRIEIVNKLREVCRIGLYGNGWENGKGEVHGLEQVKAINSGKMYLSFSHTQAGYNNVKVGLFEAMACNQFVITSYMEELSHYFEIGKEIVCYKDENELMELIQYYLLHEDEREKIRNAGYVRFLREHTYISRWNDMIQKIKEEENDRRRSINK